LYAKTTDNTRYGPGHLIARASASGDERKGSISLYCIGCGADGSFRLSDYLKFSIIGQGTDVSIDFEGNMHAQLVLALFADCYATKSWTKRIATQGIPGFSILNIVTIGPYVTFDVGAAARVDARGRVEYGWVLDWPTIHAHLDALSIGRSDMSGFSPIVYQRLD